MFFFVPFLSLPLIQKKPVFFPPKKGIFVYFLCFSFFLPQPFLASPFSVFLSLSLSLSLSCSCLSFFLLVFFFAFFLFLVFVSFSFFFLLCFCFMKTNNIKRLNCKVFFINIFSFLVSCLVFSFKSLFLIFVFPDFKLCLLFNMNVFGFKIKQLKKHQFFGQKGSCNKTFFFITCVLKNVKSYRFFCPLFFAKFWLMFKKHCKNRYFSTFSKAQKMTILQGYYLGQIGLVSGPSLLQHKNGQLGPDNNPANFCAHFFLKMLKPLFL